MKVLLFNITAGTAKKCVNKDLAGGMGTGTWVGDSWRACIFEYVKKKSVILPEIATAYLVAIFKRAGWEVELVDVNGGDVPPELRGDLALLSSSIVDCQRELAIARILKKRGLAVGVYGSFASAAPQFFLDSVDFVIKGEPESGALKIISEKIFPRGVLAVEPVADLDYLPFPDWSLFPIKRYSYSPALNKKPFLVMLTSRGCPYSCSFYCPYPVNYGKKWRARSVSNVIEEIKYLKERYGVKAIDFRDPIFTLDMIRTREIARRIIEEKLDIVWSCETRIDCLDEETITIMFKAGLRNINVGIESFDEHVLKSSRRLPIIQARQEAIIDFCHKLGVSVAAFYILGLEDDTEETIKQTMLYARKLNTLVAQFAVSTPYPGTQFYNNLNSEKRITNHNWPDYDGYTPVFRHRFVDSQKLLDLKEKAFISYYFRLSYFFRHAFRIFLGRFL